MKQPLAYIHPAAKIAPSVVIDPFVTIDQNVEIGEGTRILSNVIKHGDVTRLRNNYLLYSDSLE